MHKSFLFVPKINKKLKKNITVAELIPEGREFAIKEKDLIDKCIKNNLIGEDTVLKEEILSNLLKKSMVDWTILKNAENKGYYRPTHNELLEIKRYIKHLKGEKAAFKNKNNAKELYEDLKAVKSL